MKNTNKSFSDLTMRDNFELPVYVSDTLMKKSNIKYINPHNRVPGLLKKIGNQTLLELSELPGRAENGLVFDRFLSDKVKNDESKNNVWYASTWDGKYCFLINERICIQSEENWNAYNISGPYSVWRLDDYFISSRFSKKSSFREMMLSIDGLSYWFSLMNPYNEDTKSKKIEFKNLDYKGQSLSLTIRSQYSKKSAVTSVETSFAVTIDIIFDKEQTRNFGLGLGSALRNLFQILQGEKIGINRIIFDNGWNTNFEKPIEYMKSDSHNWFIQQSYLPNYVEGNQYNYVVNFGEIQNNFREIINHYFINKDLQHFVESYLIVEQFKLPIQTQIITLVAAVESYFKNMVNSKGNRATALEKLCKLDDIIGMGDNHELYNLIKNTRVYIIHGNERYKYKSEKELVTKFVEFKNILRNAIKILIVNGTVSNN